jgi:hypothetical protein
MPPPCPIDDALLKENSQSWALKEQLDCEADTAPPPANAMKPPETMKFSENVEFRTVTTDDSIANAPPLKDAADEIEETALLRKVQPPMAKRI